MGMHLVAACMLIYLLGMSHVCCSSFHNVEDSHFLKSSTSAGDFGDSSLHLPSQPNAKGRVERNAYRRKEIQGYGGLDYLQALFERFGDGNSLNHEGFEKLLDVLGLSISIKESIVEMGGLTLLGNDSVEVKNSTTKVHCVNSLSIGAEGVNKSQYKDLCPKLLYHLIPENMGGCVKSLVHSSVRTQEGCNDVKHEASLALAWLYASISVVLLSWTGVLALAIVPVMHKSIYQELLQYLVALAVGTLCGDALLHLLPHAMMPAHTHHCHHSDEEAKIDQHRVNLLRGLVAVLSIVLFYLIEKCLPLITKFIKQCRRGTKADQRVTLMKKEHNGNKETRVGEKHSKLNFSYSSYPYQCEERARSTDAYQMSEESEINNLSKIREENETGKIFEPEADSLKEEVPSSENHLLEASIEIKNECTTVVVRERETEHHGHAHAHAHIHSHQGSVGSVAYMVAMGDGIHNFIDGLAIGAAFAANIGGGISTAVAVFCHELPHEIGDFAVLLRAGMSVKDALIYNGLSSILSFIGVSIGILLGHNDDVKLWVFSAAAGMFLYIALVDMIPELTSTHLNESSMCRFLLQVFGFLTGISIMFFMALYEENLVDSLQSKF